LRGGNGADTLDGGTGNDTLSGASGNDLFIFDVGSGSDRVNTFQDNKDTIQLDDALWSASGSLSVNEVLSLHGLQASANRVILSFDGGETLTIVNAGGISLGQLSNDIDIV